MFRRKPLYIETFIQCDLDTLWKYTQEPEFHSQWDLRFSEINYLPKKHPDVPQEFLYSTRIGLGISVQGIGESVAIKEKSNGESTSGLKFRSGHPLAIIREGSGYWKYIPQESGIRFITGYDYQTRWGLSGKILDRFLFRPLLIRATAWSFSRLKNWIEKGINPKHAFVSHLIVVLISMTLAVTWIYHGLVPKILFPSLEELEMVQQTGVAFSDDKITLQLIGWSEILFGTLILYFRNSYIHTINIITLLLLAAGALYGKPEVFLAPFNPFTLNLSLILLSITAILLLPFVPKADDCITVPPQLNPSTSRF